MGRDQFKLIDARGQKNDVTKTFKLTPICA